MSVFKLLKEVGLIKFEVLIAFDDDFNIEEISCNQFWCQDPADLIFAKNSCDIHKQEEWDLFCQDILDLTENKDFFKKIKKLKQVNDSYYFFEENIEVIKL